jgi:hypothetical protein
MRKNYTRNWQHAAMLLHDTHGWNYADLARIFDKSPGNVWDACHPTNFRTEKRRDYFRARYQAKKEGANNASC